MIVYKKFVIDYSKKTLAINIFFKLILLKYRIYDFIY